MIIYTWPRTQSTATLMRAKTGNHLLEPFGLYSPWGIASRLDLAQEPKRSWDELEKQLMDQNTASKILGINLYNVRSSRAWWARYCADQKPYVLFRDLRETVISFVMAKHLGWVSWEQKTDRVLDITPYDIEECRKNWECFIDYAPAEAHAITFNSLPETDFNPTQKVAQPQDYQNKFLTLVKDIEKVLGWVDELVQHYEPEFTKLRKHYDRNYI